MAKTLRELTGLTDPELFKEYVSFAHGILPGDVLGELQRRRLGEINTASKSLAESSKKLADSSRQVERLTKVLIWLTAVLAVLALFPIVVSVAPLLRHGAPPQTPARPAVRQPVAPSPQGRGVQQPLPAATSPRR